MHPLWVHSLIYVHVYFFLFDKIALSSFTPMSYTFLSRTACFPKSSKIAFVVWEEWHVVAPYH